MPVVAVTRLHLRSDEFSDEFWSATFASVEQAQQAEGHLASDFGADTEGGAWTKTVWADAAAMRDFMVAPPHVDAMSKLRSWCDEAMVTHWDARRSRAARLGRGPRPPDRPPEGLEGDPPLGTSDGPRLRRRPRPELGTRGLIRTGAQLRSLAGADRSPLGQVDASPVGAIGAPRLCAVPCSTLAAAGSGNTPGSARGDVRWRHAVGSPTSIANRCRVAISVISYTRRPSSSAVKCVAAAWNTESGTAASAGPITASVRAIAARSRALRTSVVFQARSATSRGADAPEVRAPRSRPSGLAPLPLSSEAQRCTSSSTDGSSSAPVTV